jgi:hypothetical protein
MHSIKSRAFPATTGFDEKAQDGEWREDPYDEQRNEKAGRIIATHGEHTSDGKQGGQ